MSDKGRRLVGIIDEASTVIERRPNDGPATAPNEPEHDTSLDPTLGTPAIKRRIPDGITDILQRATEALPSIEVPPFAERLLESTLSSLRKSSPDDNTAPRIGEYALVARFPSSTAAEVFLGYKITTFGFI